MLRLFFIFLTGFSFLIGSESDEKVMHYLFNSNIEQASEIIEEGIRLNPKDPKYYFLKAHHNFYMCYFIGRQVNRDSVIQITTDNAEKAVALGEQYNLETDFKFYIGSEYGFLSRGYAMRQDYWDSYWAARICISYMEEGVIMAEN